MGFSPNTPPLLSPDKINTLAHMREALRQAGDPRAEWLDNLIQGQVKGWQQQNQQLSEQNQQQPLGEVIGNELASIGKGIASIPTAPLTIPQAIYNEVEAYKKTGETNIGREFDARKAAYPNFPYYPYLAPIAGLFTNVPGIEHAALQGDTRAVLGRALTDAAVAASPLGAPKAAEAAGDLAHAAKEEVLTRGMEPGELVVNSLNRSKLSKTPLDPNEVQSVMPYIKKVAPNITGLGPDHPGQNNLLSGIRLGMISTWDKWMSYLDPSRTMTVDARPVAKAMLDAIPQREAAADPALVRRIREQVQRVYGKPISVDQLEEYRQHAQAKLDSYFRKEPHEKYVARTANVDIAVTKAERDMLTRAIDNIVNQNAGGPVAETLRNRYRILGRMEAAAIKQQRNLIARSPMGLYDNLGILAGAGDVATGIMTGQPATGITLGAATTVGSKLLNKFYSPDNMIRRAFERTPFPPEEGVANDISGMDSAAGFRGSQGPQGPTGNNPTTGSEVVGPSKPGKGGHPPVHPNANAARGGAETSGNTENTLALGTTKPEALALGAAKPENLALAPGEQTQAPAPQAQPSRYTFTLPTQDIRVDPERFQFRVTPGKTSVANAKKWDPNLAGTIHVWRDPQDGQIYVVNGHHRLYLAQRTGTPEVQAQFIHAPDASHARATGAMINIAEGNASPIDAAKFFRETGATPGQLEQSGLSLSNSVASRGLALANLAQPIFDQVVKGEIPEGRAAAIGASVPDHEGQKAMLKLLKTKGRNMTDQQVAELGKFVMSAGTRTESVPTLFGMDEIKKSNAIEKAQLSSAILDQLGKQRLFGTVAKRSEDLSRAGNVINVERSAQMAKEAEQMRQLYHKLSITPGPVSDALNEGARLLAEGKPKAEVEKATFQAVVEAMRPTLEKLTGAQAPNPSTVVPVNLE